MKTLLYFTLLYFLASQCAVAQSPSDNKWAGGVITGAIRDSVGAPLVNALILCVKQDATTNESVKQATTDEKGEYRITGIQEGEYSIYVYKCITGVGGGPCNVCGTPGTQSMMNVRVNPGSVPVKLGAKNPKVTINFTWSGPCKAAPKVRDRDPRI